MVSKRYYNYIVVQFIKWIGKDFLSLYWVIKSLKRFYTINKSVISLGTTDKDKNFFTRVVSFFIKVNFSKHKLVTNYNLDTFGCWHFSVRKDRRPDQVIQIKEIQCEYCFSILLIHIWEKNTVWFWFFFYEKRPGYLILFSKIIS